MSGDEEGEDFISRLEEIGGFSSYFSFLYEKDFTNRYFVV